MHVKIGASSRLKSDITYQARSCVSIEQFERRLRNRNAKRRFRLFGADTRKDDDIVEEFVDL